MNIFEQINANKIKQQQIEEEQQQKEINSVVEIINSILSRKEKLDYLIKLGQACLESGTMNDCFNTTGKLMANSMSHHLGYLSTSPRLRKLRNALCVCGGGACGVYNLIYTNGNLYLVKENDYYELENPRMLLDTNLLTRLYQQQKAYINYYGFNDVRWLLERFSNEIDTLEQGIQDIVDSITQKLGE